MRAFFDWFFNTAAGHWVLNDMTKLQFIMILLVAVLATLSLGKIAVKMFNMVNWGFIGKGFKNLMESNGSVLWD